MYQKIILKQFLVLFLLVISFGCATKDSQDEFIGVNNFIEGDNSSIVSNTGQKIEEDKIIEEADKVNDYLNDTEVTGLESANNNIAIKNLTDIKPVYFKNLEMCNYVLSEIDGRFRDIDYMNLDETHLDFCLDIVETFNTSERFKEIIKYRPYEKEESAKSGWRNHILGIIAIVENNSRYCSTITLDEVGSLCYYYYALGKNDTSYCNKANSYKNECFYQFAIEYHEENFCEEIGRVLTYTPRGSLRTHSYTSFLRNDCYKRIAVTKNDSALCNNIAPQGRDMNDREYLSDKNECFYKMALLSNDTLYCDRMTGLTSSSSPTRSEALRRIYTQDSCIAILNNNQRDCNGNYYCLSELAAYNNDLDICHFRINNKEFKEYCYALANKEIALCNNIIDDLTLSNSCYYYIEYIYS